MEKNEDGKIVSAVNKMLDQQIVRSMEKKVETKSVQISSLTERQTHTYTHTERNCSENISLFRGGVTRIV